MDFASCVMFVRFCKNRVCEGGVGLEIGVRFRTEQAWKGVGFVHDESGNDESMFPG